MNELPAGWATAPIGNLCSLTNGRAFKPTEWRTTGIPIVRIQNLNSPSAQHNYYQGEVDERHRLKGGELLFAWSGTPGTSFGAHIWHGGEAALNQHIFRVDFDDAMLDKRFFRFAINEKLNDLINVAQGGVGLRHVTKGVFESTPVAVPPRAEQTRIADQLDTLLARVSACNDHLDAIPGILKRFRQAVLNAAAGEDFLSATPDAPFRVVGLSEVLLEPLRNGKSVRDGNGMSVLRLTSLKSSGIDLKETKTGDWSSVADTTRFLIHNGDYLVSRGNGSKELVGRGGLVSECKEAIAFPDTMIRIRPNHAELLPEYLKYVWASRFVREQIERSAKTTTGIWKVSQPDLENVRLPLPEVSAQREIVRQVDALLRLADRIESRCATLRNCAQRLAPQVLAKAFRGELVEQDPQDEPASVLLQRLAASQPTQAGSSRGRPRARPKAQPSAPERPPTDWTSLPDDAWAAPADPEGQAAAVWLTAVLRAWKEPMPERTARLASLLCQQPRLFTPVLSEGQAELWSRLVGDEAKPLPANVARFQPATNSHWGRAIKNMRVRGDLIEAGAGSEVTWTLGPGAASIETAGWPDGRAGFVVVHLRAHGVESILPSLEPAVLEFVDVRAA